jgi:hypothetical protein
MLDFEARSEGAASSSLQLATAKGMCSAQLFINIKFESARSNQGLALKPTLAAPVEFCF